MLRLRFEHKSAKKAIKYEDQRATVDQKPNNMKLSLKIKISMVP